MKYCIIKHWNIAKNPKYDGYQHGFASKVYKFFDKKSTSLSQSGTLATQDENLQKKGSN